MSMTVKCGVCGQNFKQSIAFTGRDPNRVQKCNDCRVTTKNLQSVKNLNRDVQNAMMSLEGRVIRLEDTINMVSTIVESMVADKINSFVEKDIPQIIEKIAKNVEDKYKGQLITLNNRIVILTAELEELK